MPQPKISWWKLILTWLIFLGLHFSYETYPNALFQIIGEVGETTFFHMKMLFFAYTFTSLVEFGLARTAKARPGQKLYPRMLIAVTYPWLTITLFFIAEAATGAMLEMPWEIVYANVVTLIGIYFALRFEEVLDGVVLRPAIKACILLIFFSALFTYIAFSLHTPTHFFQTPPGISH